MIQEQVVQQFFTLNEDGKYLILSPVAMDWVSTDEEGFQTFQQMVEHFAELDYALPHLSGEAYQIYRFLQRNAFAPEITPDAASLPATPEVVYLHMTSNCNIRCAYCYAEKYINKLPDMTFEQGKEIIDRLKVETPSAYICFTGGEPLSDKNSYALMKYARSLGFKVGLETNGSLINAEKVDLLKGIDIQISLDGISPEVNNVTRGRFEQTITGINLLLDNGIRPRVVATLTSSNIHYAMNFLNYWRKRGVHARFFVIRKFGIEKEYARLGVTSQELFDLFQKIAADAGSYKKAAQTIMLADQLSFTRPLTSCGMGTQNIAIDGAGNVYPCVHLCLPDLSIGNILEEGIIDIINSPALKNMRVPVTSVEGCAECPYRYFCGGGCRAETYFETRKFAAKYVHCHFIKELVTKCLLEGSREHIG